MQFPEHMQQNFSFFKLFEFVVLLGNKKEYPAFSTQSLLISYLILGTTQAESFYTSVRFFRLYEFCALTIATSRAHSKTLPRFLVHGCRRMKRTNKSAQNASIPADYYSFHSARSLRDYSHSIVPIGFGVKSIRTLLMPGTSCVILYVM